MPDAFLRRCLFHYIRFPDRSLMQQIIDVHYPGLQEELVDNAMNIFYRLRELKGIKKRPGTSELLDWIKLLTMETLKEGELKSVDLKKKYPPHISALLKNEHDWETLYSPNRRY